MQSYEHSADKCCGRPGSRDRTLSLTVKSRAHWFSEHLAYQRYARQAVWSASVGSPSGDTHVATVTRCMFAVSRYSLSA